MDMQNVAKLEIPEGEVRTIHDKNGDLLWGKVSYGVKYKGDTAQNGTPTPSAPVAVNTTTGENVVKITGKNLFNNSQSATLELGATASATSTGIRITKKSGAGAWSGCVFALFRASDYAGQVIRFSATATPSSTNSPYCAIIACDEDGNNRQSLIAITDGQTDVKLTTTIPSNLAANKYIGLTINASGGTAGDAGAYTDYANAMLTIGDSSYQDYEPYQGQSYEVNLGKNLLAPTITGSRTNRGATVSYAGDKITLNQPSGGYLGYKADTTTLPMAVKQGQSFAFTIKYKSGTINTGGTYSYRFGVYGVKADNSTERFIDLYLPYNTATPSGSIVGTATSDYVGLALGCYISSAVNTTTGDVVFDVQLELGTEATDYAAYFEPIELCKIGDYQDYIYKSGDKWYVHKAVGKVVLNGSEDWTRNSAADIYYRSNTIGVPSTNYALCNYLRVQDVGTSVFNMPNCIRFSGFATDVYISPSSEFSTLTDFTTWLSTAQPKCYYVLATPTDTEITNTALIAQLEAVDQWTTRYGYNASVTGNLPIIIDRTQL